MRYLVTGAQGFTGRFFIADVLGYDPQASVVGIGRSPREDDAFTHHVTWAGQRLRAPLVDAVRAFPAERYRYVPCDLTDRSRLYDVLAQAAPDVVVHLAAALRDDPAIRLVGTNIAGTTALFETIAQLPHKPRVVYGSSGSVYGSSDVPVRESQRCAPTEPYAMSKLSGEYVARIVSGEAKLETMFARIFNIAGPGQEERHVCGRFASQVAAIAAGLAPKVMEIGDLRPTRDFIDVRDVATGLRIIATAGASGDTYNLASGRETAIDEVFRSALAIAGLMGAVEIVEHYARAGDVSRQYADIVRLRSIGFAPVYALDATMRDLLAYYARTVAMASAGATMSATSSGETGLPSSHG